MSVDDLVSRCDRARRTGPDRWLMCCPAHEDGTASLSVRELGDGRTLVHCFAGCSVEEVLDAAGLTFEALFPERSIDDRVERQRYPFAPMDVLRATSSEATIVAIVAARIGAGQAPTADERDRVLLAAERLIAALSLLEDFDARGRSRERRHEFAQAARIAEADLAEFLG